MRVVQINHDIFYKEHDLIWECPMLACFLILEEQPLPKLIDYLGQPNIIKSQKLRKQYLKPLEDYTYYTNGNLKKFYVKMPFGFNVTNESLVGEGLLLIWTKEVLAKAKLLLDIVEIRK
jgi:hypothetical protein